MKKLKWRHNVWPVTKDFFICLLTPAICFGVGGLIVLGIAVNFTTMKIPPLPGIVAILALGLLYFIIKRMRLYFRIKALAEGKGRIHGQRW